MKHFFHVSLVTATFFLCTNWSSQETSVDGRTKHAVNFKGTITPQHGNPFTAENISIGRMYKQIPVYEAPTLQNLEVNQKTNILDSNPKDGIITYIDLSEISQIMVSDPDTLWSFQKKQHNRKIDYIVITVISNDEQKTQHNYLIEVDRKITCDEINAAGPIEKDIPWPAIKSITIHCFTPRETAQEKGKLCTPSQPCPVCPRSVPPAPALVEQISVSPEQIPVEPSASEVIIQETEIQ